MKKLSTLVSIVLLILMSSCSTTPSLPLDKNNQTPEEALLSIYDMMKNGNYDEAQSRHSKAHIKGLVTDHNITFENYAQKKTKNYIRKYAKCNNANNTYHELKWQIGLTFKNPNTKKYIPAHMCDLAIQDGVWKIVLWTEYKK